MYSGGLGVLAGDHLKSASDLGIPLIGVGLLYQEGYFRQYLTENGWQNEQYHSMDFHALPVTRVLDVAGNPISISVDLPLGRCYAGIWKTQVGRVSLYLLDTNVPENINPVLRDVTDRLYGGSTDTRIMQEMMLGIGGMRALAAMGITPDICHINEGHAAFSMLERTRTFMSGFSVSFAEAWKLTQASTVFTTHTPVPAGNEVFEASLLESYFHAYASELGLSWDQFLALGRGNGSNADKFSMTILGIKGSTFRNGVSALHGEVARQMWQHVWPTFPVQEIPIQGLVNGVHTQTWVSAELSSIYDTFLGSKWRERPWEEDSWRDVESIPDKVLWSARQHRRERLVLGTRQHILTNHHASLTQKQALTINACLQPEALTIGFARRFATYKRADLLTRDMDRLSNIIKNTDRPVQFILAGKAHPRDVQGKELIQRVHQVIREHNLENSIVFLEDYEMDIARLLVRGCDVWLNTPRRPHEASGTSGMKAALNGGLHCSILDGWWSEAYNGRNGWAIGRGEILDEEEQDSVDSATFYDTLEHDIVPRFYNRTNGIPLAWVAMMKNSIQTNAWRFAAERMVAEYNARAYHPTCLRAASFLEHNAALARDLVAFENRVQTSWTDVSIMEAVSLTECQSHVGDPVRVRARVHLGQFSTNELRVELVVGPVGGKNGIRPESIVTMTPEAVENQIAVYSGEAICRTSGFHGFTVRITPSHAGYASAADGGIMTYPPHA